MNLLLLAIPEIDGYGLPSLWPAILKYKMKTVLPAIRYSNSKKTIYTMYMKSLFYSNKMSLLKLHEKKTQ